MSQYTVTHGQDDKTAQTRKKNAESQKQYRERKKALEQATQQKVFELERENHLLKNTLNNILREKYQADPQPGFGEDAWMQDLHQSISVASGRNFLNASGHYCNSNEQGFYSDSQPIPISPVHSLNTSPSASWADGNAALIDRNLQTSFSF